MGRPERSGRAGGDAGTGRSGESDESNESGVSGESGGDGRVDDSRPWTTTATPLPRKVGIAALAVETGCRPLETSGLGSCLAVALVDERAGAVGLGHAMLPVARESRAGPPAKFVDTCVPALLAALERAGATPRRVEAKLAGGSEMLDLDLGGESIGRRNVVVARRALAERGVPVVAESVGGSHGRSVRLAPDGGLRVRTATGERTVL